MKKISNFEISSLIVVISATLCAGINTSILKANTDINSPITALIANIIGIIPVLMYVYIANYKIDLAINEKIRFLFRKVGFIINFMLCIIFFILAMTILYNINNYITSQLLYRTSHVVIAILLSILIIYHVSKGIENIARVSLILLCLSILLSMLGFFPLISDIKIENFMPFLQYKTDDILYTSIQIACINTLPIFLVGIIPVRDVDNYKKYNKSIYWGYFLGCLLSFTILVQTYGVLGNNLVNIFEYPEYITYKKITLLGFIERVENIISTQWISGSYIYILIIIYYISSNIRIKGLRVDRNIKNTIVSIVLMTILIVIKVNIFRNNTIFHTYILKVFPYVCMSLLIFYLIIIMMIFINKRKDKMIRSDLLEDNC